MLVTTRQLTVDIDFHSRKTTNYVSQWLPSTVWWLPTFFNIYIFFCVQQKKETHTGLEHLEGEKIIITFSFWGKLSL